MLLLYDVDVERLLSMKEAINAVERAFCEMAKGSVLMPSRSVMRIEEFRGSVLLMPSYLKKANTLATKIVSVYPGNQERGLPTTIAWMAVNDPETGMLEAVIEANYLTAVRTGAVTGVAARYLAPKHSRVTAIIGGGVQGRAQAWAIAEICELDKFRIFDIYHDRMKRFAADMEGKLGVEIATTKNVKDAVKDADIVVTATTSRKPVVDRGWFGDEVHVSAIGSFHPDHRELDTMTVKDGKVVVDSRAAALAEAGDLIIPLKEGAITEDHIYSELGDIVIGRNKGRTKNDGLTIFKSVGLAIQDSSVASLVLRKYRED